MEFQMLTDTLQPRLALSKSQSTSRLHRLIKPLIMMVLLVTGSAHSFAITQIQSEAENAIRQLIVNSNPTERIFITAIAQKYLSPTEVLVTGNGIASNSSQWGGQPFTYSIKVHRKNYTTRNGVVNIKNGKRYISSSQWIRPTPTPNYNVSIDYPNWNQTVNSKQVKIKGRAKRNSQIAVSLYDRNNKLVVKRQVRASSAGQWTTNASQPAGSYRAVATADRWNNGDEVRFNVKSNGNGPKSGLKNNPSGGMYRNNSSNGNKYGNKDNNPAGQNRGNEGKHKGNSNGSDNGNQKDKSQGNRSDR